MSAESKSIWRKPWHGPVAWLLAWVGLMVATAVIFWLVLSVLGSTRPHEKDSLFVATEVVITGVFLFVASVRWLCSWRNVKRLLFGLACGATLIALFFAEENWRGKRAWDNYVREHEAKGESMDWKTYIPPQIPDDQNLAMCPLFQPVLDYTRATNTVTIWNDTNGTARVYRLDVRWDDAWSSGHDSDAHVQARKELDENPLTNGWVNLAAWQNYFRTGTNLAGIPAGKTAAEDVLLGMRYLEPDLAELQGEALRRPLARWPVHYDTDFIAGILLPQLGDIRRINKTLKVRAAARLATGDVEGGLADVYLGLRLADSAATEPFVISLLVREFAVEDILQPVQEGIARHQFSEAQLAKLQQEVAGEDFLAGYRRGFQAELAMRGQWKMYTASTMREFFREMGRQNENENEKRARLLLQFAPRGWVYQNQLTLCRLTDRVYRQAVDEHSRQVFPAILKDHEKKVDETSGLYSIITKLVLTYKMMEEAPLGTARHQTLVDQTVIACALERYRLAQGEYPATLDALSPQYLEHVPHDIIGGQPLKYRRTDDGRFALYSIGWNEKDDGGQMVFKQGSTSDIDAANGDWVWQYPK